MDIERLIRPYCPWVDSDSLVRWKESVPSFRRPVFDQLIDDLQSLPQILSITGPRRVGKSTLLQQIVQYLLDTKEIAPERLIYYSLDDPARLRMPRSGEDVLDQLMSRLSKLGETGPAYLFLDEIQRFERWEQYLKKYYDLKYPVRVVVSGSASSPIFKKSHESLLGRIKDYHVLPFSFREFLLFRFHDRGAKGDSELHDEVVAISQAGAVFRGLAVEDPAYRTAADLYIPPLSDELLKEAQTALKEYLIDGGFPEVWSLPTQEKKIDYLYDNQIQKVIFEDLVLAAEFRKPEQLKTFYLSLLERPGQEVNLTTLSRDTGVSVQQIDKYLPLLEMTDLLSHVARFRGSAVRVRRGNMKFYLVDLALRNAVLRIGRDLLDDETVLGLYAENLVFNALRKWKGVLQIDYYRDGAGREVDFVVHTRPSRYMPIEVKYCNAIPEKERRGIECFVDKYPSPLALMITKDNEDRGWRQDIFLLPLIHFLLMMD